MMFALICLVNPITICHSIGFSNTQKLRGAANGRLIKFKVWSPLRQQLAHIGANKSRERPRSSIHMRIRKGRVAIMVGNGSNRPSRSINCPVYKHTCKIYSKLHHYEHVCRSNLARRQNRASQAQSAEETLIDLCSLHDAADGPHINSCILDHHVYDQVDISGCTMHRHTSRITIHSLS